MNYLAEHSSGQRVQILDGICSRPIWDDVVNATADVAQWEVSPSGYFCEFQSEGTCDSGSVSWGTSDPDDPRFCTKHFFDGSIGYELVGLGQAYDASLR